MKVIFADDAWDDYLYWQTHDDRLLAKLNELIESARRTPHQGIGKPEPLKGDLKGWWSRRIIGEHRLVYRVEGKGSDQSIQIAQCRLHY